MKVVIIIPTYNEKGNIEPMIETLEKDIFPLIKDYEMKLLIADDGSPDGTGQIVKDYMKKYPNLEISEGKKEGLGAAYVRAMTYAIEKMDAEIMFEMDCDFFHDPTKIPEFLQKINEGYDFVVGTRYSKGGSIPKDWGLHRKILSVWGNFFIRILFGRKGIYDWTGGYRAIKKEVFLKEKNKLGKFTGYTFQVGFLWNVVRDNYKIAEVPFNAKDRTRGKSKIPGIQTIIKTLYFVIKVRIQEIIFGPFGKFLVVGGTGFVIQWVIYNLFIKYTSFPLALGSWIAAQPAIFSNFNLNNLWTFKEDRSKNFSSYIKKIVVFFSTSNIGVLIIQSGIIYILEYLFGRKYANFYFIFATAVLLFWNFTMYRFVIWRKKPH